MQQMHTSVPAAAKGTASAYPVCRAHCLVGPLVELATGVVFTALKHAPAGHRQAVPKCKYVTHLAASDPPMALCNHAKAKAGAAYLWYSLNRTKQWRA